MRIPPRITAGDTVQWTDVAFTDNLGANIGSADYTLRYALRGSGNVVDLLGVAQGSGWQFTLSAAQSSGLNTGAANAVWYWQASATKGAVRITAGDGTLVVKPDLAANASTTFDGSSDAEQTLKAINVAIKARINGGAVLEYTIGTRSLKNETLAALLELRSTFLGIVSRERKAQAIKNGLGNPGRVMVRFT